MLGSWRNYYAPTLFFYIVKEVIPQFFTTLCVLSAVIVISQLIRISELIVTFGLTLENILLPFLFILLPFFSFTIPMAYLFAVLLAFGRLSADGEYTAMLASGYSLKKVSVPIIGVGIALYFIAAGAALFFEPWGRRETVDFYHRKTQTELDNMMKVSMKPGVFIDDFLGYVLYAEDISPDRSRFVNVMLAPGALQSNQKFTLLAPSASITGSVEAGNLRMSFDYGVIYSSEVLKDNSTIVKFKKAELDLIRIFEDQILGSDNASDDYRGYPPRKLWRYVNEIKAHMKDDPSQKDLYLKARFLLHQRIGMPFAAVIFAFFGIVLGIQDGRRGKGKGYLWAILTLIGGYVLLMWFKWLAEKGVVSAPVGTWLPNMLLLAFGMFLLYQKGRLPPSESPLDPHYIPFLNRMFQRKV